MEFIGMDVATTAGLPVVVANPRQVRDCAKATGQLAKEARQPSGRSASSPRVPSRLYIYPRPTTPRIRRIVGGPAQELPATVISIVRHQKDRGAFEHLASRD